jgi:hypothetical protein
LRHNDAPHDREPTMSARTSFLNPPSLALVFGCAVAIGLLALHDAKIPPAAAQVAIFDTATSEPVAQSMSRTAMVAATPHAQGERLRGDLDPVEARARVEANIAVLDARFASEPLDAAWAMREQRALDDFFAADALIAQGLPLPAGLHTACHSATCRVSARFTDPVEAEMTTQQLAMHVAARLPYGAVMPRALDDGSIQVDAWYSATRIVL